MKIPSLGTFAIILAVILLLISWSLPSVAQEHRHPAEDGHAQFHDIYQNWKTSQGGSCCNSKAKYEHGDCAPIDNKMVHVTLEGVRVFIEDEWVDVPRDKIRPYVAPDYSHHLCNRGKYIYCFVYGGAL